MADAPELITQLVARFDRNRDSYLAGGINETQLRREFIDPFFETLGWDIENKQGYAPAYREVIFEDSLKVGAETKTPDYCFRIGGSPKFFVEAKKPSVRIATDVGPAFQLRRYAWSAKLPLSILTNFDEFTVCDCRPKPLFGRSEVRIRRYEVRNPSFIIPNSSFLLVRDFYRNQQTSLFDDTDIRRVNQFDWQKAFPEVMARGGFDVIYGNPPYVRVQVLNEWAPLEVGDETRARSVSRSPRRRPVRMQDPGWLRRESRKSNLTEVLFCLQ